MLNAETADEAIPVVDGLQQGGQSALFLTERIDTRDDITLTRYEIGDPLLIHTNPGEAAANTASARLIPALGARLAVNGTEAAGALGDGARGPAVQHLRAGLLRKLDRGTIANPLRTADRRLR
jgi:hypothetical protein